MKRIILLILMSAIFFIIGPAPYSGGNLTAVAFLPRGNSSDTEIDTKTLSDIFDFIPLQWRPSFLGLGLDITSPQSGDIVTQTPIIVEGIVSSPDAEIVIDGKTAVVTAKGDSLLDPILSICSNPWGIGRYSTFSTDVDLNYGENIITAVGTVGEGQVAKTITITLRLGLDITSPQSGDIVTQTPIIVEGIVSSPDAEIVVNGKMVEVAADGNFSAEADISRGGNTITIAGTWRGGKEIRAVPITLCTEKELRLHEAEIAKEEAAERFYEAGWKRDKAERALNKAISKLESAAARVEESQNELDWASFAGDYNRINKAQHEFDAAKAEFNKAQDESDIAKAEFNAVMNEFERMRGEFDRTREEYNRIKDNFSPEETKEYQKIFE
jgi:hypothetical protein